MFKINNPSIETKVLDKATHPNNHAGILKFGYLLVFIPVIIFLILRYSVFSMNVDEAGQYWMALGQYHFTPFFTPDKGFSEVIQQNNHYNLDPGGFTYLLHFWLMISKSYLWVKLLPLLFFVGFIIYLEKLLRLFHLEGSTYLPFLIIPFLFISNALPYYSILLRAYSLEYFGIALSLYFLFSSEKPEKFYPKAGLICAIFLWSRYGFAIHILALYVISIAKFGLLSNRKSFFKNSLVFSLPILFSLILIYLITLRFQFIKPVYNPSYMRYLSDGNLKKAAGLILSQLFSFINIPVFALCGIFIFKNKRFLKKYTSFLNHSALKLILIYFGLYHMINFILSYLGLYPYSVKSYNSKQFEFFNILGVYFIAIMLIGRFSNLKRIVFIVSVLMGSLLAYRKKDLGTNNLLYVLNKYNRSTELFLSRSNYPSTRYLIEQKMFDTKYSAVHIYDKGKTIQEGNLVFYNISEDVYYGRIDFDSSFTLLESVNSNKPSYNSEVYVKK